MKISQIFGKLGGIWNIQRTLINKKVASASGTMKGTAVFKPLEKNQLHYKEEGQLTTDVGDNLKVYREYLYTYNEKEDKIEKYFFEQGKKQHLFYALTFEQTSSKKLLKATGAHKCNQDQYSAAYQFIGDTEFDEFGLAYQVDGPNKDYESNTTYHRSEIHNAQSSK